MPSPVYRGDNPGFQTQAIGNYPDASDVADKDNIYLSDLGWVYRHFCPTADNPDAFWDEIIWAGDVTDPPQENDPVNIFGADTDQIVFQTGDGIQYVTGPYPKSSVDIKEITISGPDSADATQAIAYSVTLVGGGAVAATDTWAWEVIGPGTATFSGGTQTGTFSAADITESDVNITFPVVGNYTVKMTLTSVSGDGLTSTASKIVEAKTHIAAPTIGTVTVTGQEHPQAGIGVQYKVDWTGSANDSDVQSFTWSALLAGTNTTAAGVTVTVPDPAGDIHTAKVVFTTQASVQSTDIKCVVNASTASDDGASGTLAGVMPHFLIGEGTVAGGSATVAKDSATATYSVTFTGASNPAANDLVYAWTASGVAGSFNDATSATPTFTPTEEGTATINCTVTSHAHVSVAETAPPPTSITL